MGSELKSSSFHDLQNLSSARASLNLTGRASQPIARIANILLLIASLVVIVFWGNKIFVLARLADEQALHTISTGGDAHGYQKIAVNFLHGLGPVDSESLPLSEYRLDLTTPWGKTAVTYEKEHGQRPPFSAFDRPPGFPILLAGAYAIFGTETIIARYVLAACVILSASLAILSGWFFGGILGALAGLLAAALYLSAADLSWFGGILTEIPAGLWLMVFFAVFAWYERSRTRNSILVGASGFALACFILTRFNFLSAVPILALYLFLSRAKWAHIILFLTFAGVPLIAWSGYATVVRGSLVVMSTQGSGLFATSNNVDSLYGIGPEKWNQGGWNPGWIKATDGTLSCDYRFAPKADEGWRLGLAFWRDHFSELPTLFYAKMKNGLWYDQGVMTGWIKQEGFLVLAVAFLLFALGGSRVRPAAASTKSEIGPLVGCQLAILSFLVVVWNQAPFGVILASWIALGILSLIRIGGHTPGFYFPYPTWFLAFVISHIVTTLVFYGSNRFHQPLDMAMMFLSFYGLLGIPRFSFLANRAVGVMLAISWSGLVAWRLGIIPLEVF